MRRAAILLSAIVLLAGCSAAEGVVSAADELVEDSVFSLEVGTCFDDPSDDVTEVATVDDVDCSKPHDNEVFAVFDLADGAFPGEEALTSMADEGCIERFATYVGIDYLESELAYFPITPTQGSWDEGDDREVVCSLFAMDFSKLEGSMKGAAR